MAVNLFIVGSQKAGSTALSYLLSQHPDIYMPERKEMNFFQTKYLDLPLGGKNDRKDYIKDLNEYENYYKNKNNKYLVDASIEYLYYKDVAKDIYDYNKNSKIIIILRNPVDRAFSAYKHLVRDSRENLAFSNSLTMEEDRIESNYEMIWHFKNAGLYSEQVKKYYDIFGKDNVYTIIFEEFIQDTKKSLLGIEEFLNINNFEYNYKTRKNKSGKPNVIFKIITSFKNTIVKQTILDKIISKKLRNSILYFLSDYFTKDIKISKEERESLIEFFKKDIEKLESLIKKDLVMWKK